MVDQLSATLQRLDAVRWRLAFELQAAMAQLRVPPPATAARRDGLWQHLCGELFVAGTDARYGEYNFAPSGEWAAYVFDGWRRQQSAAQLDVEPTVIVTHQSAAALRWQAEFSLPAFAAPEPARVAVCAVVEALGGERSYWALAHGAAQPDFHREDSFVPWTGGAGAGA